MEDMFARDWQYFGNLFPEAANWIRTRRLVREKQRLIRELEIMDDDEARNYNNQETIKSVYGRRRVWINSRMEQLAAIDEEVDEEADETA